MSAPDDVEITLYSSVVSNCAARLRIALNLKGLPYTLRNVRLSKQESLTPEFQALNPSRTVPLLVVKRKTAEGEDDVVRIGQSVAALEYLDDAFPTTRPLLPPREHPAARAQVRMLVNLLASDTHPLLTNRVGRAIRHFSPGATLGEENRDWNRYWSEEGLKKFENAVEQSCGRYSVGDELTLADVVLVPEAWYARRIGVDLERFPHVNGVLRRLLTVREIEQEETRVEDASEDASSG